MGREQSGAVSSDGGWHRSGGRSPGEASDADVRAAVESAVGGTAGRVATDGPATFHGVDGGPTTEAAAVTDGMHPDADVESDPERNPARAPGDDAGPGGPAPADGHGRDQPLQNARTGSEADADGAATEGTDGSDPTPAATSVGVGVALLTIGVLLVAYRTMLAAGAGEFVAGLYGVGGLLIVGGFIAHAIRHADDVTI